MEIEDEVSQFINQSDVFSRTYDAYHELFRHGSHVFGQIRGHGQLWFVKSLANPSSSADRAMLRKEFEIMLRLSHPGVVRVVDLTEISDVGPSIVMELVSGMPLDEYVGQPGISRGKLKQVTAAIIETMAHVHANGVVHHDLKPSNILVCQDGWPVKIIDFGMSDTDSYAILKNAGGTDGYIAPERLSSEYEFDMSSDVWAIASIVKRLGLPGVPRRILSRCMSADSNHRLSSAGNLNKAIKKSRRRVRISACVAAGCIVLILFAIIIGFLSVNQPDSTSFDKSKATNEMDTTKTTVAQPLQLPSQPETRDGLSSPPVKTESASYSSLIAEHDALIRDMDRKCALLLDSLVNVFERDSVPSNERRMRLSEEFTNFMRQANVLIYDFKQRCPQELLDRHSDEWCSVYARPLDRRHRKFTELMRSL